jgi:hypothetical protein
MVLSEPRIHWTERRTPALVNLRVYSRKQTSRATKSFVPSFFVKMNILGVDLLEEA